MRTLSDLVDYYGVILCHYRVTSLSQFALDFSVFITGVPHPGKSLSSEQMGQLTTLKQADRNGECDWIGF